MCNANKSAIPARQSFAVRKGSFFRELPNPPFQAGCPIGTLYSVKKVMIVLIQRRRTNEPLKCSLRFSRLGRLKNWSAFPD